MNKIFYLVLSMVLLVNCEQERSDDTRDLHPYSGDKPVVFAFLRAESERVDIEAMQTVPYYSTSANAALNELTGNLVADGVPAGTLVPEELGRYSIDLEMALSNASEYSFTFDHPGFGVFRTAEIIIPIPVNLMSLDTVHRQGRINISGEFSSVPTGLSVSSKLLRYGEGMILNNNSPSLLPVRSASEPLSNDFNLTQEYTITEQFTIFDQETLVPTDTINVDSVQLILYTWGEEVIRFNRALAETNASFGDGSESIDGTSWTNVIGGHGLVAGFAADTLTLVLR